MILNKRKKLLYHFLFNRQEYHLILDALMRMRNQQLEKGCYTDEIDETIIAITK